jgi:hypothetical protein
MRHVLALLALAAAACSPALAACPATQEIVAFGRTFAGGGLIAMLNSDGKDCDDHKQPGWLATINAAPAKTGTAPGLAYCRQIAATKEQQNEAQRHDCIYWYGHSIEAP